MHKTADQIDKLNTHTIPIDTWILEHIKFNYNDWKQKVPIGSKPVSVNGTQNREYDTIDYYRDPNCSGSPIFTIEYWTNEIRAYCSQKNRDDKEKGIKISYDNPIFFDKLESWIWNVRTIDYIMAHIESMSNNLESIKEGLVENKEHSTKKIGYLSDLHHDFADIGDTIRDFTRQFLSEGDEISYPIVDGQLQDNDDWRYDPDDVPF